MSVLRIYIEDPVRTKKCCLTCQGFATMIIALWRRRLLELRNYLCFRLDLITRIEMAAAIAIVLYFSVSSLLEHARQFDKIGFITEGWQTFLFINFWVLLLLFFSGMFYALRPWLPVRLPVQLPLPIPARQLAISHLGELLFPVLLLSPFWLIWNGWVLLQHLPLVQTLPLLLTSLSAYVSLFTLGLLVAQRWQGRSLFNPSSVFLVASLVLGQGILIYAQFRLPLPAGWIVFVLQSGFLLLLSRTWISGFAWILEKDPARLTPQPRQRHKQRHGSRLESWFIKPVPASLRALVHKDLRFALRCYRGYPVLIGLFLVVLVVALLRAGNGRDALQWQLSLSIALVYLLANSAFRFNAQDAENWALLKSLPVKARDFWWSKFYVVFLPLVWFIGLGHLLILVRYQTPSDMFALNMLASLAISFTLAFLQTNFSLYTFPFARYASLWYNLYIWTAVLFFTILLFPPLAIAFLFYGFYAIRRVLKRYDQWVQA